MRVARRAHITQNNKVAISFQYIRKEVSDEIDFLHIDKHESSLQINTMIFHEDGQTLPKFAKYQVCNVFTIISKNKLEIKLFFCMQINIKISYKFISTLWVSKFPTTWYYLYWWTWSSILKVLKLTSLQYLYNISKKKLGKISSFFASR